MVWQGPDLPPLLLLPRLLRKLPSTASGSVGSEPEDWGSVGSGPEEPSPALALEVCPQLQLLKQPNMVLLALEVS